MKLIASIFLGILISCTFQSASFAKSMDRMMAHSGHTFMTQDEMKWMDAPNALPTGAKMAVLEGNPMNSGPFTMRIMLPANYRIPPHWHPSEEHVTVISGMFHLGMGSEFDGANGKELPAGSFAVMAPGTKHYAWTTEKTVIQLHGMGPWKIKYVNPLDDPRNHPGT